MMKHHATAQGEGPRQAIAGGLPKLGNGRNGAEVHVILYETVEYLPDHRPAIDIDDEAGVKPAGIVGKIATIYTCIFFSFCSSLG